jgi:DNA-binding response OmpR family regulator
MGMPAQRILIVEDSPYVAGSMRDALEAMGYETTIASTAAEAMAALEQSSPALILLDWMLPDQDGLELLRQIRQGRHSRLPVIMLTARAELDARLRGLEAGADDYLAKPFNVSELQEHILALLPAAGEGS